MTQPLYGGSPREATTDLRYPIGPLVLPPKLEPKEIDRDLQRLAAAPSLIRRAVSGLGDEQLDTPYRDGGWTIRQVPHHLVDSHINAYVRVRLALTEENPTIKPYDETRWAELSDARTLPVEPSLSLLEALHERWVTLLRGMPREDFGRTFLHPEHGRQFRIDQVVAMYAWHGEHHAAHITRARERLGWTS